MTKLSLRKPTAANLTEAFSIFGGDHILKQLAKEKGLSGSVLNTAVWKKQGYIPYKFTDLINLFIRENVNLPLEVFLPFIREKKPMPARKKDYEWPNPALKAFIKSQGGARKFARMAREREPELGYVTPNVVYRWLGCGYIDMEMDFYFHKYHRGVTAAQLGIDRRPAFIPPPLPSPKPKPINPKTAELKELTEEDILG